MGKDVSGLAQESYHHDNLKAELIEKGLKLLDEAGYEGFSLRQVAKACNVSHAAPYRHFKNKDELILAIGAQAMTKFSLSLQAAVDRYPDDPGSQLKEMGYAYVRFFAENPEYLRLIFLSDITQRINSMGENINDIHCFMEQKGIDHPFDILYKAVARYRAAQPNISNSGMDQEALVLHSWGLVHGIAILIARKEFPYQGDLLELARTVIWNKAFPD